MSSGSTWPRLDPNAPEARRVEKILKELEREKPVSTESAEIIEETRAAIPLVASPIVTDKERQRMEREAARNPETFIRKMAAGLYAEMPEAEMGFYLKGILKTAPEALLHPYITRKHPDLLVTAVQKTLKRNARLVVLKAYAFQDHPSARAFVVQAAAKMPGVVINDEAHYQMILSRLELERELGTGAQASL